jgi:hypothetical protein
MMQFKVPPTDHVCNPTYALPIRKANPDGSPKLPTSIPSLIPYCPIWGNDPSRSMERQKFISVGLSKYMDFQKVGITQNATYEMKMKLYMEYWEDILLHLSRLLPNQNAIFWRGSSLEIIGDLTTPRFHC